MTSTAAIAAFYCTCNLFFAYRNNLAGSVLQGT